MNDNSKDLLHLESKSPPFSAIESKLLVCGNNNLRQGQNPKPRPPDGMPLTSSAPKSQVMGKVKDFLGVISEANRRLEDDAKDNVKDYDIEVLTGNEYIEMDLMLGVADLHTPEAVVAAESAIAGYQPVISLAPDKSETESDDHNDDSSDGDDSDDSSENDDDDNDNKMQNRSEFLDNECPGKPSEIFKSKKRPKIVELP